MADSFSGRLGAEPLPYLAKCDPRPEGASSHPTLRPGEAIWRVALGVEEPLQSRLSALVGAQRDMTCALATSRSRVLELRLQRSCPDVLIVDMAWGDVALGVIERTMRACPLPIVVIDTELWTPYLLGRLEQAWKLGIVGVIPYPTARELRSRSTRGAVTSAIRAALPAHHGEDFVAHSSKTKSAWSESPA